MVRFVAALFCTSLLLLAAAYPFAQGAELHAQLIGQRRLVAFGDLHGDLENAIAVLRAAGLCDATGRWIGGRAVVVQVGDLVDRGPHGHSVLEFFAELAADAARHGGELVSLIGNHELMNMQGDLKFVAPAAIAAFGGAAAFRAAHDPVTGPYGRLIAAKETAAVRGASFFVHAGLWPPLLRAFAQQRRPTMARSANVDAAATDPSNASEGAAGVAAALSRAVRAALQRRNWTAAVLGTNGPLWTRTALRRAAAGDCRLVDEALAILNDAEDTARRGSGGESTAGASRHGTIHRIVVGHTIQPNGHVAALCGGRLVAIDVCVSQYMSGCGFPAWIELPLPEAAAVASRTGDASAWNSNASFVFRTTGRLGALRVVYPANGTARHALHSPWKPRLLATGAAGTRVLRPLPSDDEEVNPSLAPIVAAGEAPPTGGFALKLLTVLGVALLARVCWRRRCEHNQRHRFRARESKVAAFF